MTDDEYEIVRSPSWAKTTHYIRKKDKKPLSKGRLRVRLAFAEAAHESYKQKGLDKEGLPIIASNIREEMSGKRYGEDDRVILSDEILATLREKMLEKGITALELPSRFVREEVEPLPEISEQ